MAEPAREFPKIPVFHNEHDAKLRRELLERALPRLWENLDHKTREPGSGSVLLPLALSAAGIISVAIVTRS